MAAKDPVVRSRAAQIASNVGWARTPNRTERAAAGFRASPMSIDYWRNWAKTTHPEMNRRDQLAAAINAHRAHQQQMSLKAAQKRTRLKEEAEAKQGRRSTAAA